MPPEAIRDSVSSDPRSDLYSVGALAYYLLTGTYAYDGETIRDIHEKQLAGPPPLPSRTANRPISTEMDALVLRCLATNPDQRPQTARELRELLLATPHATEWTIADQTAWWEQFNLQPAISHVTAAPEVSTPLATVKIDINTRLQH
jgi:serine/threonine-protein kinase